VSPLKPEPLYLFLPVADPKIGGSDSGGGGREAATGATASRSSSSRGTIVGTTREPS
jgi:hypothetical protein